MAKVMLKGWPHEIGEPRNVSKDQAKEYWIQEIIFLVPGYKNEFQDIDMKDEPWKIEIRGLDKINRLSMTTSMLNTRMTATVYIEGYAVAATETKPAFFGYRASLHEYELFNPKA